MTNGGAERRRVGAMGPSSLVGRVTLAGAVAAALGGSVSALSASVTARELVAAHETTSLRAAALELADEVTEEVYGELDDDKDEASDEANDPRPRRTFPEALIHELEDVKIPDARAAVWLDEELVAGDRALPRLAADECTHWLLSGREQRACSVQIGRVGLTLVAPMEAERARGSLFSRALWVGLTACALLGALASFVLARWAVAPLSALRDRVRALRVDDPRPENLGGPVVQSEVEELRQAVVSLVERLGAALESAQAFAAEAAHELRTPLTTIGGELELLATSKGEPDPAALARVRAQVAELTSLVQRLLVLAQPTRLPSELSEVVDLSDVLAAVLEDLPQGRTRVQATCADDVVVSGDFGLLRVLLANAIQNALKFSQQSVAVSIAKEGRAAVLEVRDRGPGIPDAERVRVFEPFYRSPGARASGAQGHGLGLALIARVAFRHGGRAEFIDQPVGACLRVELPLWRSRDASRDGDA